MRALFYIASEFAIVFCATYLTHGSIDAAGMMASVMLGLLGMPTLALIYDMPQRA